MKSNTKKIILAVAVIASIIIVPCYYIYHQNTKNATKTANISSAGDSWIGQRYSGFQDLEATYAKEFLISTSNPLASQAGAEILDQGGTAIDAAIAAQMVLNVVNPQSSGIGGGGFLLYYDAKSKTARYFNGRETAPLLAHSKMFLDNQGVPKKFYDAVQGGLSVGTPGLLKMLKTVHEQYGKLTWQELFQPAVKIARIGFPMDREIYVIANDLAYLKNSKPVAKLYFKEDGSPKDIGEIITNPELADTLEIIANQGIEPFYNGKIGEDIVAAVQNSKINPGYLSMDDLKQYEIKEGNLVCGTYRLKYKICSMPLPSSGGIAILQILGILENFDLAALKPSSAKSIHLISEATRLAYADRNQYIADVAYAPIKEMLSKKYLKSRSSLIDINKAMQTVTHGRFNTQSNYVINNNAVELPSTTHLSIIDKAGNAVAFTSSIEYLFGSTLMTRGFMLNNQLTDFSFIDEIDNQPVANRLEPKKQPRSSMSPTLVFDNQNNNLIMAIGSPGGPRIIQYTAKTIIARLDWNMDIQEAISLPNHIVLNDIIELEKRTDLEQLKAQLEQIGHQVKITDLTSGINGVTIDQKGITGGADHRRGGSAIGK